jgi:hypothetical protein
VRRNVEAKESVGFVIITKKKIRERKKSCLVIMERDSLVRLDF